MFLCWPHSAPGNVSVPCPSYLPWISEGNVMFTILFYQLKYESIKENTTISNLFLKIVPKTDVLKSLTMAFRKCATKTTENTQMCCKYIADSKNDGTAWTSLSKPHVGIWCICCVFTCLCCVNLLR